MVHVRLGPEGDRFTFLRRVLYAHSASFADYVDGSTGDIDLTNWHPGQFRVYMYWAISGGSLPDMNDHKAWWKIWAPTYKTEAICLLPRLQTCDFACAFNIHGLYKACHNSFVTSAYELKMGPTYKVVLYAYQTLCADQLLLDFLVVMHVWWSWLTRDNPAGHLAHHYKELPTDFCSKVMETVDNMWVKAIKDDHQQGVPGVCTYHIHDTEEDKAICLYRPTDAYEERSGVKLLREGIVLVLAGMGNMFAHQLVEALRNLTRAAEKLEKSRGSNVPDGGKRSKKIEGFR